MTHKTCIRFAPLHSVKRQPTEWCRPNRNLYQRGGLKFFPGTEDVPLLVDHDDEREIGRVHQLVEWDDIGGPWLVARANITDPPDWLKRGTKASFGFKAPQRSTFIDGWVYNAFVTEVSVLSPSVQPKEPLAQVVLLERSAPPKPARQIAYTPPRIRRATRRFSDSEIRERLGRAADSGIPGAVEREIEAMKRLEAMAVR